MTIQEAVYQLAQALSISLYEKREAQQISYWAMEYITKFTATECRLHAHEMLSAEQLNLWNNYKTELLKGKPIQYILHEVWFYGKKWYVDEGVLIPRPETEELLEWIIDDNKPKANQQVIDIGTGSGCLAITLKKEFPDWNVWAIDISNDALTIAKHNAAIHEANVQFEIYNILNKENWPQLPTFDIVVSNPPYVLEKEKAGLHQNVLQYEPHIALFVPNEKPLLFYEAIAQFCKEHLNPEGSVYVEVNEMFAEEVKEIWKEIFHEIIIQKDMAGKNRMVKARKK